MFDGTPALREGRIVSEGKVPKASHPVEPGDAVERGKVLGLVEVMKCFNQIAYGGEPEATEKAVVVRVVLEDAAEVKLGQVLFVLDPR